MPVHGLAIRHEPRKPNNTVDLRNSRTLAVFLDQDHGGRDGAHDAALAHFQATYQRGHALAVWGVPPEHTPPELRC